MYYPSITNHTTLCIKIIDKIGSVFNIYKIFKLISAGLKQLFFVQHAVITCIVGSTLLSTYNL